MADSAWAQAAEIRTEDIEGALVAYDLNRDQVHSLDAEAAAVYRACKGSSLDDIASATGLDNAVVAANLVALEERNLIGGRSSAPEAQRRKFLLGAAGAAVAAGILSITAPSPAMASSMGNPGDGDSEG